MIFAKKKTQWLIGIAFLFVVIFSFFYGIYFFRALIKPVSFSPEYLSFSVPEGIGVNELSRELFSTGLIKDKFVFETYVWLLRAENRMVAGEYQIPKNISIVSLVSRFVRGPEKPNDRSITFIEGWTVEHIARYLENEGLVKKEDFLFAASHPSVELMDQFSFLKNLPDGADLEGYLFPDTYRVFIHSTSEDIIKKALANFTDKIHGNVETKIQEQKMSIHEVLTLASIIEAEVRTTQDRKIAADIFLRRLKYKMPLQSDATINYITKSGRSRATLSDLEIESPYNTYKFPGLPPGPISNPSLDAITAVLDPTENEYYFFLTDENGRVYYAKNIKEHANNRAKYLK